MTADRDTRYSPKTGEPFELLRQFDAARGRVAVIREVNGGGVWNVPVAVFAEWVGEDQ